MKSLLTGLLGCVLILIAYQFFIVRPEEVSKTRAATEQADKERIARYEKWAYVEKEKSITTTESLKLIVVPSKSGYEFGDTKCLVYTNDLLKTSSVTCNTWGIE